MTINFNVKDKQWRDLCEFYLVLWQRRWRLFDRAVGRIHYVECRAIWRVVLQVNLHSMLFVAARPQIRIANDRKLLWCLLTHSLHSHKLHHDEAIQQAFLRFGVS